MDITQQHHFYASSVSTWMVDNDIHNLMARIESEGLGYNLFYVPVPIEVIYEIRMYAPTVDGTICLGYKSTNDVKAKQ